MYIKPEENIILNVPSATIDFTTSVLFECCSLLTKQADIGHWLHIQNQINLRRDCVTKSQLMMSMLGRSKSDKTGNGIGDESYEEARIAEIMLFKSHRLLSKVDESMICVPVLARKLAQIQATIISSTCLKLSEKLLVS